MGFSTSFIDHLKSQADIVTIAQGYIELKKKGNNWMGCCPFHREKTASFSVNSEKEIFHCFGCKKGGSVFSLVMELEGVSFPEAVRIVAEKAGVEIPKDVVFAGRSEADDVIQLNTWAMEWWEAQLNDTGRLSKEHLDKRAMQEETIKRFHLGHAPDRWDGLLSHLKRQGATKLQLERSGLVVFKEDKVYDRFRNRLMFPIMDTHGKVIAFSGRALKDDDIKYINSPETAAYVKGSTLYGLHLAKGEMRSKKFCILMEGNFDLITSAQAGVTNAVATLGTALTGRQAKLVSKFTDKVVINYDGDNAGLQAAKKAVDILLLEGIEVKVLVLPGRLDPDQFIREKGVVEYNRQRGQAKSHLRFLVDQACAERNLTNPVEKAGAVEDVLPHLRAVTNPVQKRELFDMAMDSLRIREQSLVTHLWREVTRGSEAKRMGDVVRKSTLKPTQAELELLDMLFSSSEVRDFACEELQSLDLEGFATGVLLQAVMHVTLTGIDLTFDSLSPHIEGDRLAEELTPMLLLVTEEGKLSDKDRLIRASRCLDALRRLNLDKELREAQSQLAQAQRDGDVEAQQSLSMRAVELARKLQR